MCVLARSGIYNPQQVEQSTQMVFKQVFIRQQESHGAFYKYLIYFLLNFESFNSFFLFFVFPDNILYPALYKVCLVVLFKSICTYVDVVVAAHRP